MLTASAHTDPCLPQGDERHLPTKASGDDLQHQQPPLKKPQQTQGRMRRRHSISTTGFRAASVGVLDAHSCAAKPRSTMATGGKVLETRASSSSSLLMLFNTPARSPAAADKPRHSIACMITAHNHSATPRASAQTTAADTVSANSTSSSAAVGVLIKQRHRHQRHVQIHHSTSSAPRSELPILRCQYVARNVQVLVGTRWRLRKFETRHVVLHVNGTATTSPLPTLAVWDSASKDLRGDAASETRTTTFTLPLTLQCSHNDSRHELKLKSTNDIGSGFRIKVRFATAADARIWRHVLQATMAHARWAHSLDEDTPWLSNDARVVVAHHGPTNEHFVIKVLPRVRVDDGGKCTELLVLKKLYTATANASTTATNSSGLAYLLAYRVIETARDVRIVMPKLPGTNLLQFLQQQSHHHHRLPETEAQTLLKSLCRSLAALHALGIVHCDLKLENILLTDVSNARIIDFGGAFDLAWVTDSLAKFRRQHHRMIGTPGYIAPERIQHVDAPPSPAADVFSLGVILFQLLTGRQPFARQHHGYRGAGGSNASRHPLRLQDTTRLHWASAEHILRSHGVSPDATDLVQRMVDPDPDARIPVPEILRHAWCS